MTRAITYPSRRAFLGLGTGAAALLLVQRDGVRAIASAPTDLARIEFAHAAQKAALCSAANVAGVGLRGEYFAAERCAGTPLLVRLDAAVDFDASHDWPGAQAERPRSVRWSGWVKPALGGRYRFHGGVNEARIVVARQVLAGRDASAQADIELAAGRFYPIGIEIARLSTDTGRIRLEWTAPHGGRFAVPRALLYEPTAA